MSNCIVYCLTDNIYNILTYSVDLDLIYIKFINVPI